MKNDLEKLIKNALEDYEIPYEVGAWESFKSKIDAKSAKNAFKWWIPAATLVVISISIFYFLNTNESQNQLGERTNHENEKLISNNKLQNQSSEEAVKPFLNHQENKSKPIENNIMISSGSQSNSLESFNFNTNSSENNSNQIASSNYYSSTNTNVIPVDNIINDTQNPSEFENIPIISNKCKNESITIENKNSFELILKTPSGREIGIEGNSKSEINLKEIGVYQLGYTNSKTNDLFKESSKFKVFGTPEINLNLDDFVTYKNGLPIVNAESNSSEENVIWKINSKVTAKIGKSTEFNFFNRGSYTITAQSKNEFGCESNDSKTIQINEDYNLLAMSAFNPNSSDYRNNSFLPYALKERNSAFKMIILDPDNGAVIFETSESTNPWTGIDRRDGKMVVSQKAFIWKVTLSNPEPGEKAEYKGTVVRVP
jgi:hypothetical protein